MKRENQGWLPASQWVDGRWTVGTSAEEQVSEVGGGGANQGLYLHLFLEGGYLIPNTGPSDGREQVVFTCSWALNKRFM